MKADGLKNRYGHEERIEKLNVRSKEAYKIVIFLNILIYIKLLGKAIDKIL